jgi:hypothetical protein
LKDLAVISAKNEIWGGRGYFLVHYCSHRMSLSLSVWFYVATCNRKTFFKIMNSVFCREVLHNAGLMHAKNWNVSFVWPSCQSMKHLSGLDWDEKSLYLLYLKERRKSYIIQDGRMTAILKIFYWHLNSSDMSNSRRYVSVCCFLLLFIYIFFLLVYIHAMI